MDCSLFNELSLERRNIFSNVFYRLKIDSNPRENLEDYLKKEAFHYFLGLQAHELALHRLDNVTLKLFYLNPKINKFAIVEINSLNLEDYSGMSPYETPDNLDNILNSNHYQLFIKDLSCTFLDEIPSKFIRYQDLTIEAGTILSMKDTMDVGQYLLNKFLLNEDVPNNVKQIIPILNIVNKNYEKEDLFNKTSKYYQMQLFPSIMPFQIKSSNLVFNEGNPIKGKEIYNNIACTNGISILDDGRLSFKKKSNFYLILKDSMDGLLYHVEILDEGYNGSYKLHLIKDPEALNIKESYNPYVLEKYQEEDPNGPDYAKYIPRRLVLNNKEISYI